MPKWTEEQELAIQKSGMNIIVSAGAGSGKTAVLTERVIRKLKAGIDVNELLILTFTNAAAKEMKERIRSAIKKEGLTNQLLKIDSSFITTFDSFALSVVKKYHYLLNIDNDVEIADALVLKFQKEKLLDGIFEKLYEKENSDFLTLIKDFTRKDDSAIKESVLEIYNKLDLKYNKDEYLNNYLDTYYDESFIDSKIKDYLNLLKIKQEKIRENLKELELIVDGDYYFELYSLLEPLLNSVTYLQIKEHLEISLPRLKKGMTDAKLYKDAISANIKELKKLTIYDSDSSMKEAILSTKKYVKVLLFLIQELENQFDQYKKERKLYDFLDISKLAIKIVSEFPEAREELKSSFSEILVDEYQDTSDLQETFIRFISKNNVYMVGDIKQSIYRFRNANPNLFKEKYINYEKGIGGFKIDLVKNFRSREETLANINFLFDDIMDIEIGGADYKKSHRMVFGNTSYNDFKKEGQDNNFELYNYTLEDKEYSREEIEAFITVQDIQKKVENHYQVYDKNKNILRDITYDDFVVLMDKSTSFELYKKIFESFGVTLTIVKDENIGGSYDLAILKNILVFLFHLKEKKLDKEFWYCYLSLGRSYLFCLDDSYLYEKIKTKSLNGDPIIEKAKPLLSKLDEIPLPDLIHSILIEFQFYEKFITVGNIEESLIRLDYLEKLSKNLGNLSYTYVDFITYFEDMILKNEKIQYSLNKEIKNSVKIMTIHKSKGLEYPVCYYTGLTSKFNVMDTKKRFFFEEQFGIVTPYVEKGISSTIYPTLYRNWFMKEDISERIRLFYVALTRAKEKMILITDLKEEEEMDEISLDTKLKYSSFASILNSLSNKLIPYIKTIDLSSVPLTKNYTMFHKNNIFDQIPVLKEKIEVRKLNILSKKVEEKTYSKISNTLKTEEEWKKLEFGTSLHKMFEIVDFKTKDLSFIESKYHSYFQKFFSSSLIANIKEANIYKEYEFVYKKNGLYYHGIIDLLLEYKDHIDIVDYKLKNIEDSSYENQLKGYREYIKTKTPKPIFLYLYSIFDGTFQRVE